MSKNIEEVLPFLPDRYTFLVVQRGYNRNSFAADEKSTHINQVSLRMAFKLLRPYVRMSTSQTPEGSALLH